MNDIVLADIEGLRRQTNTLDAERSAEEFWTLRDLSDEFGMDVSSIRKFIVKNGIETYRRRTVETGNQLCLCLDRKGYEEFKGLREGFLAVRPMAEVEYDEGIFYFIQLVPEALPNRIKLGFTNDLAQRLQSHRCAAPTLKLLDTWGIKPSWESMAIAAISNIPGTVQVGAEVFDFPDAGKALERANSFFSFLEPAAEEEETSTELKDE